jgi:hypothetical protein
VTSIFIRESFDIYEDVFGSYFYRVFFVLAPDLRMWFFIRRFSGVFSLMLLQSPRFSIAFWFRGHTSVHCFRCPFFFLTAASRSGFSGSRSWSSGSVRSILSLALRICCPVKICFFGVFRCFRVLVLVQ